MKVLVTGANFTNKGAQSMLFVTVNEIVNRFPSAEVFFQTREDINISDFNFKLFQMSDEAWGMSVGRLYGIGYNFYYLVKSVIKKILKRESVYQKDKHLIKQIKNFDVVIDISGFVLGDKWDDFHNNSFLNKIDVLRKYNIPVYLMPQSIGPFHYEKHMNHFRACRLRKRIAIVLQYPKIIFARERMGIDSLSSLGIKDNVVLSTDLVLQNKRIELKNIFNQIPHINLPVISSSHNIAVIPNKQCLINGSGNDVIALYCTCIKYLKRKKQNVYIIKHSKDDDDLCNQLYEKCKDFNVIYINRDLSCIEYDSFIRNFDFVVGSRYHSLVHALKNNIPCIALGWAVKYKELLVAVGQGQYNIDVSSNCLSQDNVIHILEDMYVHIEANISIINDRLTEIRKHNCFDLLDMLDFY